MNKLIALLLILSFVPVLPGCSGREPDRVPASTEPTVLAADTQTRCQTEPAASRTLDRQTLQSACAQGFIDPSQVTVLAGEWAYTADPNKFVALATVRYTDKDGEYETADFLMLGVFGGEIELYHILNEHSPYTQENGLREFGAVDDRRFPLE